MARFEKNARIAGIGSTDQYPELAASAASCWVM